MLSAPMIRFSTHSIQSIGMLGAIAAVLLGCGMPSRSDADLNILTTSTILRDWTEALASEDIEVTSILKPGEDPHVYEPVPQDTIAIESADFIFYNGYNLEPGLIKLIQSSSQAEKEMAVGEVIVPLDYETGGSIEPDPHVWGSVKNAIAMIEAIRTQLVELSPEDADETSKKARAYTQELEALDQWVTTQIQTIPPNNRQLVTTHDAFQYYANAYGLNILGTLIGISTEEQPSAQTVKNLALQIQKAKIPKIFAETTINPALLSTVAGEAGVELSEQQLYSDSLGTPESGADSYVKMIVANTTTIVEGLGGEITPFKSSVERETLEEPD
jgi:manganese/iron transport system substrate-binding protein